MEVLVVVVSVSEGVSEAVVVVSEVVVVVSDVVVVVSEVVTVSSSELSSVTAADEASSCDEVGLSGSVLSSQETMASIQAAAVRTTSSFFIRSLPFL